MELTLSPHELFALPADTPATGRAFRLEVTPPDRPSFFALVRLLVTEHEKGTHYKVFFRDEKRPAEEVFRGGNVYVRKPPLSQEQLLQEATQILNRGSYARYWKAPELSYCLYLVWSGSGCVIQENGRRDWDLDFCWNRQVDNDFLFRLSASQFHAVCEQLVNNETSQLNFAMNWRQKSPEDKTAFAIRCEYGDWEEMVRLFTSVLRLIVYQFGSYPFEDGESSYWDFSEEIPTRYDCPAVYFARRWQDALFKIIGPPFWLDYHSPLCVRRWRRTHAGVENTVYCETPTAHEYLEAQLHLRKFLRPHLSAGEIEALFIP